MYIPGEAGKVTSVDIPFFVTEQNQEYLLDGYTIDNSVEVIEMIKKKIDSKEELNVFKIRIDPQEPQTGHDSEYPDVNDEIVGRAIGVHNGKLRVVLYNTLYYSKLSDPVIRINGYCVKKDKSIHITNITRLSLSNRQGYEGVGINLY